MPPFLRFAFVALCCLMTAACDLGAATGTRSVTILAGAMRVQGPAGYCVGLAGSQTDDTAVVLIGPCAANGTVAAALVTVSVGRAASAGVMVAGPQVLADFFSSPPGRRTLSRNGNAADVRILAAAHVGDALLLHLQDRAVGEYWRAILGLNGRLVTVSALGTDTAPLTPDKGRALVDATLKALQTANPPHPG